MTEDERTDTLVTLLSLNLQALAIRARVCSDCERVSSQVSDDLKTLAVKAMNKGIDIGHKLEFKQIIEAAETVLQDNVIKDISRSDSGDGDGETHFEVKPSVGIDLDNAGWFETSVNETMQTVKLLKNIKSPKESTEDSR